MRRLPLGFGAGVATALVGAGCGGRADVMPDAAGASAGGGRPFGDHGDSGGRGGERSAPETGAGRDGERGAQAGGGSTAGHSSS